MDGNILLNNLSFEPLLFFFFHFIDSYCILYLILDVNLGWLHFKMYKSEPELLFFNAFCFYLHILFYFLGVYI